MDVKLFYDLMVKSLSGNASNEEENQLNEFLKKSDENEKLFNRWKLIWDKLDESLDDQAFDKDRARQKIIEKIQLRKTRQVRIRYWVSAAASILILMSLGYLTLIRSLPSSDLLSVTNTEKSAKELVLPDGSHVWLNRESTISYPEQFTSRKREVELTGEAFFEVTKDPERVFRVATDYSITKVLGTSFNLKMAPENEVCLVVETGRVQFYKKYSLARKKVFTAGEKAVMHRQGKLEITSLNADENYLSWKTGTLIFDNTPLPQVCKVISEHYDLQIECEVDDPALSLTGSFYKEEAEDVLSTIGLTFDLKITHRDNKIILHQ